MNIKCPYCSCCYEINCDILGTPIGNEKLGYGWWLRCCRCHKKWWLKNSHVEKTINTPLKADKSAKIGKLASLIKKKHKKARKYDISKIVKYVLLMLLAVGIACCYYFKNNFLDYINAKAIHLRENISSKLELINVKYNISENNTVTVTGNIINKDNKNIIKCNGIKINILKGNEKIDSWDNEFDEGVILPQQQIPFSSSKRLKDNTENIIVEVLIF